MSKPPFPDLDELLQRFLDDQILPDERMRLEMAMRDDLCVRQYYMDSMLASAVLRRSSQATGELSESDLILALARDESQGDSKRKVPRRWIAAILIVGVSILTSLSVFWPREPGPAIGTLISTYKAQWRRLHVLPGDSLYAGRYDLREGAARMELDQGVSLFLEAPCQVQLAQGGEVTLKSGRLAAVVSSQGKGFRVRTPTALITDMGTEFGVLLHRDGSTETHVLKGRVNVALDPNKAGQSKSLDVHEGQAAKVDAYGRTIQDGLTARRDLFLLMVPSPGQPSGAPDRVNLADIVGGGNGHGTGDLDRGIDLGTGRMFRQPATEIQRIRRNEFQGSAEFRGIDGVFVPNRALGQVVVSSTGLLFAQCPETRGSYYGGPANSGEFYDLLTKQAYRVRLNGVSYGTSRHPALSLHANAGITFDLDEIRQDHPNIKLDRFTAVCGIPKDLPHPRFSPADVWVLLDGVLSLHLRYPRAGSIAETVDVAIPAQARFLTLAATCPGRADYAWIILGDPFLESAAPVQQETRP
ncbi:MAG: FecR family protein [Phycisphaerae bacterium]|nr:FecR family protein [Phycisphaerae bacterium]